MDIMTDSSPTQQMLTNQGNMVQWQFEYNTNKYHQRNMRAQTAFGKKTTAG